MKKRLFAYLAVCSVLPLLTACKQGCDYTQYLSEAKHDVFYAEGEGFSVTLSCITREYPYCADGICSPKSDLVEISVLSETSAEYTVSVLEPAIGGETTYRTYAGDYFFSVGVSEFPKDNVSLHIERDGVGYDLVATSVKNEETISVTEALHIAVAAEKETVERLTQDGNFTGEFYVRLLRRDANYYYVGIIDREGKTISLLLNGETGKVLARRAQ